MGRTETLGGYET